MKTTKIDDYSEIVTYTRDSSEYRIEAKYDSDLLKVHAKLYKDDKLLVEQTMLPTEYKKNIENINEFRYKK
jgi:hypothetical protein